MPCTRGAGCRTRGSGGRRVGPRLGVVGRGPRSRGGERACQPRRRPSGDHRRQRGLDPPHGHHRRGATSAPRDLPTTPVRRGSAVNPSEGDAAVFLDRDGVLIQDVGLLRHERDIRIPRGVPAALRRLSEAGFRLICISNQTVVARGLLDEPAMHALHERVLARLEALGAPPLTASYLCPHHPHADDPEYRRVCICRKPSPGMVLAALRAHRIDASRSFMVGDRISDVVCGHRAGCRTVLVESGRHSDPPIVGMTSTAMIEPGTRQPDLLAASEWIVSQAGPRNTTHPAARATG
ncbi:MAG: HAD family hydrolase [Myxococcales bacterium FL481]|nr:MAG: HAD family hydrolase [Myxococcales bacterium FL481]